MRPVHFVFICLLLISVFTLARKTPGFVDISHRSASLGVPHSSPVVASAQRAARKSISAGPLTSGAPTPDVNFSSVVTYDSGGMGGGSIAVADLNGDGNRDVVIANSGPGTVGVLLGNADGTFQTEATYSSGGLSAWSVAIADVNLDGKPDVIVANTCTAPSPCTDGPGAVGVLLGNGDGTFQTAVTYSTGGYDIDYHPSSVAVMDVNGDGKPDLIVANNCKTGSANACTDNTGTVAILLGNGGGTFQAPVIYDSGGYEAVSVAVADVNRDGKPDVVVANLCADSSCTSSGSIGVLLANGDGTFQRALTYGPGVTGVSSVAVADVNGDGKPDLLVTNPGHCVNTQTCLDGSVAVLLGNGDGTFQTASSVDAGGDLTNLVVVADINGDGKPDLVVANSCADAVDFGVCFEDGQAAVLLGNGDGTFQAAAAFDSGGSIAIAVAVADVNGDGRPDLLVANFCGSSNCLNGNDGLLGVLLNTSPKVVTTTLSSSPNPSAFDQAVTFTATVKALAGGTPTGTVSFSDSGTNIGNSDLNSSSMATLTVSTLVVGTHSIIATYYGDANFGSYSSPLLTQTVQQATGTPGDFSLTALPSSNTLTPGQTGNYTLTISPLNGFDQKIALSCSGAPPQSTCTISPGSVTLNGSADATATVAVATAGNSATLRHRRADESPALWLACPGLSGLVMLASFRRRSPEQSRRRKKVLVLLGLLILVMAWPACGSGSGSSGIGTPTGTYTVTITGSYTSGSATLTHTTKVTLVVN